MRVDALTYGLLMDSKGCTKKRLSAADSRELVIGYLRTNGGAVHHKQGLATRILYEGCGYPNGMTGLALVLKNMSEELCPCGDEFMIDRVINGKKVFRIALAQCLMAEPEATTPVQPAPVSQDAPLGDPGSPTVEPEVVVVQERVDYDVLAMALVSQFAETLAPKVMDPELQARLGRVHDHARSLEAKLRTMKQDLEVTKDRLSAKTTEAQGLRQRLQAAEENIERLKAAPIPYDAMRAQRELEVMMQERPHVGAGAR